MATLELTNYLAIFYEIEESTVCFHILKNNVGYISLSSEFLFIKYIKNLNGQYVFKLIMGWSRASKLKEIEKQNLFQFPFTKLYHHTLVLPKVSTFYRLCNINNIQLNSSSK